MPGLIPHSWLNGLGIPPWVWNPLSVSLRAAFEATVVVTVVGVALGYLLAKGRFPGRNAIETLFSLPIALPPTVVGFRTASGFRARPFPTSIRATSKRRVPWGYLRGVSPCW